MTKINSINTILLVDDNRINLLIAEKTLARTSYKVFTVDRGAEAIALSTNKNFDLILMDLFMPGKDGYETSKEIRRFNSDVIILALSSTDVGVSDEKMAEHGIDGFLNKPFSIDELNEKLKTLGISNETASGPDVLKDAIFDITRGKDEFKDKLISLYLDNINELQDHFTRGVVEKDYERLNFITHKVKTTIKMLKLEILGQFISDTMNSLENDKLDQDKFLSEFSNICTDTKDQLTKLKNG